MTIPQSLAKSTGLHPGDKVSFEFDAGRLIISPISRRKYSLQELLAMQGDEPLVIDQAWDNMPPKRPRGSGLSRKVWQRGDIVAASLDPTLGQEQQGRRPGMVVTHADLNRLGVIGVCPITQGGVGARNAGFSVSLMGTGTQTQGVVLVHQFRMILLPQRRNDSLAALRPHIHPFNPIRKSQLSRKPDRLAAIVDMMRR